MKSKSFLLSPDGNPGGGNPPLFDLKLHCTIEERDKAVEAARSQEKQKLYQEMESLRGQVKTLTEKDASTVKTIDSLNEQILGLQGQLEAIGKAKGANGEIDVEKLVAEVSAKAAQSASAQAQAEINKLRTDFDSMSARAKKAELDRVKAEEVAKAGGKDALIYELVGGETPEEIIASVALAKSRFEAIISKAGNPSSTTTTSSSGKGGGNPSPVPPVLPNGSPSASSGDGTQLAEVRSLSIADYSTRRNELLAASARRYQESISGRP